MGSTDPIDHILTPEQKQQRRTKKRERKTHLKRMKRGEGKSIAQLAELLGISSYQLENHPIRYQRFQIPKRDGRMRTLHAPEAKLKDVQRTVARKLLAKLAVHPCATAYRPGKHIGHNALPHTGKAAMVKCDLQNFFPSTSSTRIDTYFRRIGWDARAAAALTRLTTHEGGLPQGAPTSPVLSNLVNYAMDCQLHAFAQRYDGDYTRYADDITISFKPNKRKKRRTGRYKGRPNDGRLARFTCQQIKICARSAGYQLNGRKTKTLRRHQRMRVTGLVVNEKVQLPRELRRKLRAVAHHIENGRDATLTPEQLQGWIAYQQMLEQSIPSAIHLQYRSDQSLAQP